jgi:hypothetical protein
VTLRRGRSSFLPRSNSPTDRGIEQATQARQLAASRMTVARQAQWGRWWRPF